MLYTQSYDFDTPFGKIAVAATDEAVTALWFEGRERQCPIDRNLAQIAETPLISETAAWIRAYFDGKRPDPSAIPVEIDGSAFRQEVLRIIEQFPEKVKEAADRYEPYVITRYAVALASAFNRFYHENAILSAEDESVRKARTALTKMMAEVLRSALSLIGVQTPEEM